MDGEFAPSPAARLMQRSIKLGQLLRHSEEQSISAKRESIRRSVERPTVMRSSPHDFMHSSDSIHSSCFSAIMMDDCVRIQSVICRFRDFVSRTQECKPKRLQCTAKNSNLSRLSNDMAVKGCTWHSYRMESSLPLYFSKTQRVPDEATENAQSSTGRSSHSNFPAGEIHHMTVIIQIDHQERA